jgi:predicted MFS family arabinose efflux permease
MDVPTRQSYVMAVVECQERTFASGITHLVRLAGWALAPFVAGSLMSDVSLSFPLVLCGTLKIIYDVLLYVSFRQIHPPEEM